MGLLIETELNKLENIVIAAKKVCKSLGFKTSSLKKDSWYHKSKFTNHDFITDISHGRGKNVRIKVRLTENFLTVTDIINALHNSNELTNNCATLIRQIIIMQSMIKMFRNKASLNANLAHIRPEDATSWDGIATAAIEENILTGSLYILLFLNELHAFSTENHQAFPIDIFRILGNDLYGTVLAATNQYWKEILSIPLTVTKQVDHYIYKGKINSALLEPDLETIEIHTDEKGGDEKKEAEDLEIDDATLMIQDYEQKLEERNPLVKLFSRQDPSRRSHKKLLQATLGRHKARPSIQIAALCLIYHEIQYKQSQSLIPLQSQMQSVVQQKYIDIKDKLALQHDSSDEKQGSLAECISDRQDLIFRYYQLNLWMNEEKEHDHDDTASVSSQTSSGSWFSDNFSCISGEEEDDLNINYQATPMQLAILRYYNINDQLNDFPALIDKRCKMTKRLFSTWYTTYITPLLQLMDVVLENIADLNWVNEMIAGVSGLNSTLITTQNEAIAKRKLILLCTIIVCKTNLDAQNYTKLDDYFITIMQLLGHQPNPVTQATANVRAKRILSPILVQHSIFTDIAVEGEPQEEGQAQAMYRIRHRLGFHEYVNDNNINRFAFDIQTQPGESEIICGIHKLG